jgi:hypothetical protein
MIANSLFFQNLYIITVMLLYIKPGKREVYLKVFRRISHEHPEGSTPGMDLLYCLWLRDALPGRRDGGGR